MSSLEAQLISPPQSLWGEIEQNQDAMQVGGVELLAGLLMALASALGVAVFLAYRRSRLGGRGRLSELKRLRWPLVWCTYAVTPLLGLATIMLAGPRLIFGVEVALVGVALSLATITVGTLSLVISQPRR